MIRSNNQLVHFSAYHWHIVSVLSILFVIINLTAALDAPTANSTKGQILPPCQACKNLVNSFVKGMERTSRGKFEGGDADWEETRLGNYATSEVRLVEIQEKLCTDTTRGQDQCHTLAAAHEELIEKWWFEHQKKDNSNLQDWLCVQLLRVCCPDHHFGSECKPCPGAIDGDSECSSNGKCKGSGTRKGNGHCVCDKGYVGDNCQHCAKGFFSSYKDDKKNLCTACHQSCKDVCTQAGPKGCLACNEGWAMDTEMGCVDVDECITTKNLQSPCPRNTFCVNSPGSHSCLKCDKACDGCLADGPDNCMECAENHIMKDGDCTDDHSITIRTDEL